MQEIEFEINRDAAKNYFLVVWMIVCFASFALIVYPIGFGFLLSAIAISGALLFFISFFSILFSTVLFLAISYAYFYWLCPQQANNLRYRLDGSTLRADGGVFFLFRKSIPLERITDVALVQGPLLRFFDIWAMRIQTAGSAQCEATLYGVRNPEEIRELILSQRQRVYGEKAGDA